MSSLNPPVVDPFHNRVLLVDPSSARREMLARRLGAQGYVVESVSEAVTCAEAALATPPAAVVADLWMPGISGVQLCRLLRAEPATADVPVLLCGDEDEPRNKFWAERAGAAGYVLKGRTGDLVRALTRVVAARGAHDDFFVQLGGSGIDIRERLARHLDAALFESILAAELRALAASESFDQLFDRLAQLLSQVTRYRWVALTDARRENVAIHHHPSMRESAALEARAALRLSSTAVLHSIEDDDASAELSGPDPMVQEVPFASSIVARFAFGPCAARGGDAPLITEIVARELGGAVKMTTLLGDSLRLASTDTLTGLQNRRSFATAMGVEVSRCRRHGLPLGLAMFDLDHFKHINDARGHAAGDSVLAAIGELLRLQFRAGALAARWGGEEFIVAFLNTDAVGTNLAGERLRQAIERMIVNDEAGDRIPVTASVGLAVLGMTESLDALVNRADKAMYLAKTSGRNRTATSDADAELLSSAA